MQIHVNVLHFFIGLPYYICVAYLDRKVYKGNIFIKIYSALVMN